MQRLSSFVLAALVLAACGDNNVAPDARPTADAPPADAHVPQPIALAVAGDFGSPGVGTVAKLDLKNLAMTLDVASGAALGDPVVRYIDGNVYIINRFGSSSITILDGKTLQLVDQFSTGMDSNPQDVAVVGDKLYVPATGTAGVVVITRPANTTTTIDLSSLDSVGANDGKPDCIAAYAVGTKVYVACGMLDSFAPVEPGKVAVIDTATDTMTSSITLPYSNPSAFFAKSPDDSTYTGDLLIPTVPSFSSYATGCIARVSTTGATPGASCGPTNMDLGGYANKVDVTPDGSVLYVAVGTLDANFANPTGKLRGVDLESGMIWPGALSPTSQLIIDVAACPDGQAVATDQTTNKSGLRVWQNLEERTTDVKPIGLRPTTAALICYDP